MFNVHSHDFSMINIERKEVIKSSVNRASENNSLRQKQMFED